MTDMAPSAADGGSRPIPDPTLLTTQQLLREIDNARALFSTELDVLRERLTGMDRAASLLNEVVNRVPTDIDRELAALSALIDQRFASVSGQMDAHNKQDLERHAAETQSVAMRFTERDVRAEREARDNRIAVDAAFSAQKEAAAKQDEANQKAIDKSEKATAETLNKLQDLFQAATAALATQLTDVKDRLARIESARTGAVAAISERRNETSVGRQGYAILISSMLAVIAAGSLIALILKP